MCGITGIVGFSKQDLVQKQTLMAMTSKLVHRGPDDSGYFVEDNLGFGFRRLSIVDLENGNQPFLNDDNSIISICNGEIFNYRELRKDLHSKGYTFKTECDVEVIIPLYQEYGCDFVEKLNGQFAIAIYDKNQDLLVLIRDHVGIAPMFYTVKNGTLIFGSEIKSILAHPAVERNVNLQGLDQIFSFPGLVSPTTMFKDIHALEPGCYLTAKAGNIKKHVYWDLNFPSNTEFQYSEQEYIEQLDELLRNSVKLRLNADVPVGYYLSGGLDSSLIAGLVHDISPNISHHCFSVGFEDKQLDERSYQEVLSEHLKAIRHETIFGWENVDKRLRKAIYHSEAPLKETYNTCSLALSELVRENDMKVVLSGEGSDELFAGYVGYRFDALRTEQNSMNGLTMEEMMEQEEREKLWGDKSFFYEKNYYELRENKLAIYSDNVKSNFIQFNAVKEGLVDKTKLKNRHPINKRSYIDFKLRMSDHLLADHGDRVAYGNSVEIRYPFLDPKILDFTTSIPIKLKLNGMIEKFIVKKVAEKYIPSSIANREKFHFVAPGSPSILSENIEWIEDILSYETISQQGYFNPETVENIKNMYRKKGFRLNLPFDTDWLIIILTFGIFLEEFEMPSFN